MIVRQQSMDDLDEDQWETSVSVHSPVVRASINGTPYTTYAVSLKSDNFCFSQPCSCVHRRYSEFSRLRSLLKTHHPSIDPPSLPPKKYFSRFSQSFINERTEGLQEFMKGVLDVPVYLSNKAVHLFLQSHSTMSEIEEQVSDDVPVPKVLSSSSTASSSDYCSDTSSENGTSVHEDEQNLKELEDVTANVDEVACEVKESADSSTPESPDVPQVPKKCSEPIPILPRHLRSSLVKSRSFSPHVSPTSSVDSSNSPSRRVSFCDKVKVAIVHDQLWNIGTRPIRSCAF